MAKQVNPNAYKFASFRKPHRVVVELYTDMVPGWGYELQDHIDMMFRNSSYLYSAEVMAPATVKDEHREWSEKTFGEPDLEGLTKHLVKEAKELEEAPTDAYELADLQMLIWSIQRGMGLSDKEFAEIVQEKLDIHRARNWPAPVKGQPTHHLK